MTVLLFSQDWDFPYFDGSMDIKLPGLNTGNFHFRLPGGEIRITGKWFNYGIIFIVMILDLNMWKNQIFYEPFVYGQYTDDQQYIYTVSDKDFLANATDETLSYAWRWTHVNPLTNKTYGSEDQKMNSRYIGYPLSAKGTAFIPSLLAFTMFGILVKYFSKGGPPNKVAPANEMKDVIADTADVKDGAEDSSSSPHITMSRQSMSSYKSEYAANKTRKHGSFLSMDSSHDNVESSQDNLDSSRDNLESSRDELRSSRDDLRSSDEGLQILPEGIEEHSVTRPAWSDSTPEKVLPEGNGPRRDSLTVDKSSKRRQSSTDHPDNETMALDISVTNLDLESEQSKKNVQSAKTSVGDSSTRTLSFGDLFRRDTPTGSRSVTQLSDVVSDDEMNSTVDAKPAVEEGHNFLQIPRA